MPWSNVEVQSVEIVQDITYAGMEKKINQLIKQQGIGGVRKEINQNYDMAIKAVYDKKNNVQEGIWMCDETLKIALINLFVQVDLVKSVMGWSTLKESILSIMEAYTDGKNGIDSLFAMAESYKKLIREEESFITEFGEKEEAKKLVELSMDSSGKTIVEVFADIVVSLIKYAEEVVSSQYGYFNREVFERNVMRAISAHIRSVRSEEVGFSKDKGMLYHALEVTFDNIINTVECANITLLATPFTYSLNKTLQEKGDVKK